MSEDDTFWGAPHPPKVKPKATKPQVRFEAEDSWRAGPKAVENRRFEIYAVLSQLPRLGAGLTAAASLVLVSFAAIDRNGAKTAPTRALPPKPIIAHVVLAAGDTRNVGEFCTDEDIPVQSCRQIEACSPGRGMAVSAQRQRVLDLVLRPGPGNCGNSTASPGAN